MVVVGHREELEADLLAIAANSQSAWPDSSLDSVYPHVVMANATLPDRHDLRHVSEHTDNDRAVI